LKENILSNKWAKVLPSLVWRNFGWLKIQYMEVTSRKDPISYAKLIYLFFCWICYLFCLNLGFKKKLLCVLFDFNFSICWCAWSVFFGQCMCRYNQIDKHLCIKATQWIMSGELKDGYLLRYEEAFSKKKVTFENTKIILYTLLFISLQILQVYLCFFWWLKTIKFSWWRRWCYYFYYHFCCLVFLLHHFCWSKENQHPNLFYCIGHIFNHLQNCPITINYVTNPKSILWLMSLDVIDK
jgi:hypothetical protein